MRVEIVLDQDDFFGAGKQRFSRGALYLMLKNRIYRGEIVHKGKAFPGEHSAIVDEELWSRVQRHLEENRDERHRDATERERKLLTGILFDAQSNPMTPVSWGGLMKAPTAIQHTIADFTQGFQMCSRADHKR
jgi:Recombinase